MNIFFIHTVNGLTDAFSSLAREHVPAAKCTHVSDQSLIQAIIAATGPTAAVFRRVCDHVAHAEASGASVVQLTCSTISPCADVAAKLVSIPVLKIDDAMMEHAAANFRTIGLAATNPGTLGPSTDLLREKIAGAGRGGRFETVLCDGAFDAFLSGDMKRHDEIVTAALQGLMKKVDVVVLAQASMARIADALPDKRVPVLASPPFAMKRLALL